jgi:pimeloyl-ACP methyl ester carboxylesterase
MTNISGQLNINGQMLYVEFQNTYENRPTIVFLHDSLGCVALWRDFPRELAGACRCNALVYDRLGYGKSAAMPTHERSVNYMEPEADTLNDLLTTLNIGETILFGHSDGGSIALLAANKHPYRIKGIICEAAHVFVEEVTLKGIYEAIEMYGNTDLRSKLEKYHGDKADHLFKAWTKTWTRSDFRDWSIEQFLPGITCPLLFIQGDADEYGTLAQVDCTVERVRGNAEKFIIPNIGHTPHKEVPELVVQKAREFILSIDKS